MEELVQIYVGKPHSLVPHPEKELKEYLKIKLAPKEERDVALNIPFSDLEIFDVDRDCFLLEQGDYIVYISRNANDDLFKEMIEIKGEKISLSERENKYLNIDTLLESSNEDFAKFIGRDIPKYVPSKKPYTMETPICEYRSFFGRIVKGQILKTGNDVVKAAKKIKDEKERLQAIKTGNFIKRMISQNCLRSIVYSSGGLLSSKKAEGVLDIANGKIFKGLKKIK